MDKIDKKDKALQILQSRLETMQAKLNREGYVREQMSKKRRLNLLIEAGKVFEEAGILEDYDRNEVLEILKDYRRRNE